MSRVYDTRLSGVIMDELLKVWCPTSFRDFVIGNKGVGWWNRRWWGGGGGRGGGEQWSATKTTTTTTFV